MTEQENSSLDELVAADAQGERIIGSLWPGDQFLYRHEMRTITRMQRVGQRQVAVWTECGHNYLFDGFLMFPAVLSGEHFDAENPDREVW